MAEVAQQAQHEFWRPPMQAASESVGHSEMVEACDRCATEFIVGSRYCHSCGSGRPGLRGTSRLEETISLAWLSSLGERLGLSTAAFIAFSAGILCVLVAAGIGVVFSAQKVIDWQAVQLWRIQWLLGAIAAFVAGSLLKGSR
ncbi:MAG: hypothetical protein HY233_05575 [Acidobacteriales bacterium]|nr:hypothetical protein [Candidatus Koribacter versatilis]MBI3645415.1 hypothetical protein [Terriglobales bacterium]